MRFEPSRCPLPGCPSLSSGHRRWCFKGRYRRACDGRFVQRFLCLECRRTFSVQTFRVDYRLKRPDLTHSLFAPLVSKVTHRQAARVLGCDRKTVAHRLQLLGEHCRRFHFWRLERARLRGGLGGTYQLDELETYEHSRRLAPLTLPVLIERRSYFVLDLQSAPLPCRGGLSRADRERKAEREKAFGPRRSGSRAAVDRCLATLERFHRDKGTVHLQSDRKASYRSLLAKRFAGRLAHERHDSRARRDYGNPLFPINHTLAMMRDGISRLVRRTWAASKLRERLVLHAWIWAVWRNYVRGITNRAPGTSPAMAIGVESRPWTMTQACAWRVVSAS